MLLNIYILVYLLQELLLKLLKFLGNIQYLLVVVLDRPVVRHRVRGRQVRYRVVQVAQAQAVGAVHQVPVRVHQAVQVQVVGQVHPVAGVPVAGVPVAGVHRVGQVGQVVQVPLQVTQWRLVNGYGGMIRELQKQMLLIYQKVVERLKCCQLAILKGSVLKQENIGFFHLKIQEP